MNTINRFDIKDCLALFFIIDEADVNVGSILGYSSLGRYQYDLLLSRQLFRSGSKVCCICRTSSSDHLLNGWFTRFRQLYL